VLSAERRYPGEVGVRVLEVELAEAAASSTRSRAAMLALVGIVGASAIIRLLLARLMQAPWIVPDEIIYSELAKSIAAGELPAIRGAQTWAFGPVYPTLLAPAWWLGADAEAAYRIALGINAFVMSLAALPAYGLARMMVTQRKALVVAAFAVLVPSMAYTNVLMTENAFYPAFLAAAWAIARTLERPSVARQAYALAAIGLLTLIRVQGVAMMLAYAGAVALHTRLSVSPMDRRAALRRFAPSVYALGVMVLTLPLVAVASGAGMLGWLGAYSGSFGGLHPLELPGWFVVHVADLALYVAVAPFAATVVLCWLGLRRVSAEPVRLFTAIVVPTCAAMLTVVAVISASVDVRGHDVLNERYLFYVVPLLLVGLALWIEQGLLRPARVAVPVAVGATLLAALIPFDWLSYNANFQALALLPWVVLDLSPVLVGCIVGVVMCAFALLWLRVGSQGVGRLWVAQAWVYVLVGFFAVGASIAASDTSQRLGVGEHATWIDDATPAGSSVTVLWRRRTDGLGSFGTRVVMLNEFFNRRVGRVVSVDGSGDTDAWLTVAKGRRTSEGVVVDANDAPVRATYVLALCSMGVNGTPIASDRATGAVLYRVDGAIRIAAREHRCFGLYGRTV
jgi:hypothetical protein